jgi:hypothetical protein
MLAHYDVLRYARQHHQQLIELARRDRLVREALAAKPERQRLPDVRRPLRWLAALSRRGVAAA